MTLWAAGALDKLTGLQWTALVGGLIMISTSILLRRTARRGTGRRLPAGRTIQDRLDLPKALDPINDAEVRFHEIVREMFGRLDGKIHVLNTLVIEAEQAIDQLKRLSQSSSPHSVPAASTPGEDEPRPADLSQANPSPSAEPLVIELDAAAIRARALAPDNEFAQRFSHVFELADQGLSSAQIGDRTGQAVGDVELLLSLRRARRLAGIDPPSSLSADR